MFDIYRTTKLLPVNWQLLKFPSLDKEGQGWFDPVQQKTPRLGVGDLDKERDRGYVNFRGMGRNDYTYFATFLRVSRKLNSSYLVN
jgi:hypothetical protein